MKIKSKKYNSSVQDYINRRKNYRKSNFTSVHSTNFYRQCHSYDIYHKYKYTTNRSVKRFSKNNDRKKCPPRPVSPEVSPNFGSEEYMKKKVEQTSAIIMKQLLNPDQECTESVKQSRGVDEGECSTNTQTVNDSRELSINSSKSKVKKGAVYNIDEIHRKIIHHITNLNDGKKKNLINFNMSGYDTVIDQIQKQRRLEISRALRAVCSHSKDSKSGQESSNFINSIIPDMGIKIEDLPQDLIEELTKTLNLDSDWSNDDICNDDLESDNFFVGSFDVFTTNVSDKYEDKYNDSIFMKQPTKICIKSDLFDKQNEIQCSKSHTELNGNRHENNSNRNITSNTIDTENNFECLEVNNSDEKNLNCSKNCSDEYTSETAVVVKKEICEQPYLDTEITIKNEIWELPESDCCHIQSESTNNYQIFSQNIKKEGYDQYENSNDDPASQMNMGNTIINEEIESNKLLSSCAQREMCHILKETENKNSSKNGESERGNMPVEEINQKTIKDHFCHNAFTESNWISTSDMSTQTEENCAEMFVDYLLTNVYKQTPNNLSEAISRMLEIDQCILKLTNFRQSLFTNIPCEVDSTKNIVKETTTDNGFDETCPTENKTTQSVTTLSKKRKKNKTKKFFKKKKTMCVNHLKDDLEQKVVNDDLSHFGKAKESSNENEKSPTRNYSTDEQNLKKSLKLPDIHEKVIVIKVVEDKLLAGTESGKIIFFNLKNGHNKKTLNVCSVPITSVLFIKDNINWLFVGSYNPVLKIYNFHDRTVVETINLEDSIQCMETNWDYIFIGCNKGSLLRYSLKKKAIECEDKYSDSSILVIKATQEGARRVLLIGSRNVPLCIRDAMTGLYMRTMEDVISPTVYSLIMEKNLIYCGTTNHDILVYSFHNGKLVYRHKATDSKGIGCMKIVKNLLFASCHNGNIYVYDIRDNIFIDTIHGPGGVILSMEIFENQVIIGTMSFKFVTLPIPEYILKHKL